MSEEQVLPTDIGFDDKTIIEASKRKELREGWYRWLITGSEKKVSAKKPDGKGGNLMIKWTIQPLTDPADASSVHHFRMSTNSVLPLKSPTNGMKAPNSSFFCYSFFQAALGMEEFPAYPKWEGDTLYFKDEAVDGAEENALRQQVTRAVFTKAKEIWLDDSARENFHNCAFYGELFQNGQYKNLREESEKLPEGIALVAAEDFLA
jgi:hypothetical protein